MKHRTKYIFKQNLKQQFKNHDNKTKYSYLLRMFLCVTFILALTGCGDNSSTVMSTTENMVSKAGSVQLYHATETAVEPDEERYQLVQPDNLSAALEEIIENMTLNSNMTIEKYLIDEERNITLFIDIKEGITEEEILLNQAAIVKSMQGIDVNKICISLQNKDGEEITKATYTDASFYYYDE